MKNYFLAIVLFFSCIYLTLNSFSQEKLPLSHNDYDHWNVLGGAIIGSQGNFASYEVYPQEGDGILWLYDVDKDIHKKFMRGKSAIFSPEEDFIAFKILAEWDTLRQAKLDGKKKDDLPKDSLGIYLFDADSLLKFPELVSFKVPEESSSWLAWLQEKIPEPKDTAAGDSATATKATESKQDGKTMFVYHPGTGSKTSFENVSEYIFSKSGEILTFITTKKDSIDSVSIQYMIYPGIQSQVIYEGPGYAKKIISDESGQQLAWLFTADTTKLKIYDLWMFDINKGKAFSVADTSMAGIPQGLCVSENSKLGFSSNGKRLFFGTAEIPVEEPEDTLTEDEKVSVDIWNWKDPRLQPHQLKKAEEDKKRAYEAIYHIPTEKITQLADDNIERIRMDKKKEGPYALGLSRSPYYREMSWDADGYQDVYLIDVKTGERKMILKKWAGPAFLSPLGRYLAYYDIADSSWNSYVIKSGDHIKLTAGIPVSFASEDFDMPSSPWPYGMKGWTENDKMMIVYDRYDLWLIHPEGKSQAMNLTNGRDDKIQYRYYGLDPEIEHIPSNENLLLRGLDENNKDAGFFHLKINDMTMKQLCMGPYRYYIPQKAKNADKLIWQRMNFVEYPDLYLSDINFRNVVRLSDANPQQDEYLWGSVELVSWISSDGVELDGLLYKPENFDPDSTYPMIVYFYEKYSNSLHAHYYPKPSRSTVNFTYYVSNGYLVFVPDIIYKTGFPGQGAYNSVVSGTLQLMQNPWVDKNNIGIQGQSWGGYQVAYLVTQTNMFAAAMAGAPVSNMTSAYGGIRWGSGLSRMFQYEGSQSRIGATLWEAPWRYIENSPVFFADKVETPLLMMHNDDDGAVPWYQGIEYFVALRRLNKPVWMLTYNGAPHNLKRRADCKDLSIRMQQFFDHYLKGAPAPVWMEYGIPAVDKGKIMGYELVK